MSTFTTVILLLGSMTLTQKIRELISSMKAGNKEKMKVDVFFLCLTLGLIALLLLLQTSSKVNT